MKKSYILILSMLALVSCGPNGAQGNPGAIMVGAQAGGMLGAIIGHGGGHHYGRGSYAGEMLGSVVGTVAGAVIANAITSPKPKYSQDERDYNDGGYSVPESRRSASDDDYASYNPPILVQNIRFADDTKNQAINANEQCSITFDVANTGAGTYTNLMPVVALADKNKHILISPSATIDRLGPNEEVRYTAYIQSDNRLKNGDVYFRVYVKSAGRQISNTREFPIQTSSSY